MWAAVSALREGCDTDPHKQRQTRGDPLLAPGTQEQSERAQGTESRDEQSARYRPRALAAGHLSPQHRYGETSKEVLEDNGHIRYADQPTIIEENRKHGGDAGRNEDRDVRRPEARV